MKILYTGSIYPPYMSTCMLRMQALEDLGHEVHPHCSEPYNRWGGRYGGALFRRYHWGPPINRYNRDLLQLARDVRPDVLWVDKGQWLFPKTLTAIQEMGATAVFYTPDAAFFHNQSRWLERCIPLYDIMVTTKPYEVDLYHQRHVQRLILKRPMFDARVHHPVEPTLEERQRYECDIIFIGTYTPRRDTYLLPLIKNGFDVAIWGSNWRKHCTDPAIRPHIRGDVISGRDYALGLFCAKIGLGLLNPLVPDTSTTRTVEIPAVGTFLLAERTFEHKEMFEEGSEAEFFDSAEELLSKASYYLSHEQEREAIAAAGYQRCMTSGYDVLDQLRDILSEVEQRKTHGKGRMSA